MGGEKSTGKRFRSDYVLHKEEGDFGRGERN